MGDRTSARPGPASGPAEAPPPGRPQPGSRSVWGRVAAYALVLLLTALLALWGSFLVPLRIGGAVVPVSWGLALVGNLLLGRAGARIAGAAGAVGPGVLWLALVFVLAGRRTEGDVVVPGSVVGTGFLLLGALASAVAYGLAVVRPVVSSE